jgi:hypothetical protein
LVALTRCDGRPATRRFWALTLVEGKEQRFRNWNGIEGVWNEWDGWSELLVLAYLVDQARHVKKPVNWESQLGLQPNDSTDADRGEASILDSGDPFRCMQLRDDDLRTGP